MVWDWTHNISESCLHKKEGYVNVAGQASCVASVLLCLATSFAVTVISLFPKCQKPQGLVLILVCSLSAHFPDDLAQSKSLSVIYMLMTLQLFSPSQTSSMDLCPTGYPVAPCHVFSHLTFNMVETPVLQPSTKPPPPLAFSISVDKKPQEPTSILNLWYPKCFTWNYHSILPNN